MKNNNSIFSFFKRKKKKLTQKQLNEMALEKAKSISDKMVKDKQDSRNLFLEKLLENARAYNEAKEDFSQDGKEENQ